MWYVVDLLFAKPSKGQKARVWCEICNVLFEAPSAIDAYHKALPWAEEYSKDNDFQFVGVEHMRSLDNERPGDGTEIGGCFSQRHDPWMRKAELIPAINDISAVVLEANLNVPIKDLVSPQTLRKMRAILDSHPPHRTTGNHTKGKAKRRNSE